MPTVYTVANMPMVYKDITKALTACARLRSGRKEVREWTLKEGMTLDYETMEEFPSFKTWLMQYADLTDVFTKQKHSADFVSKNGKIETSARLVAR